MPARRPPSSGRSGRDARCAKCARKATAALQWSSSARTTGARAGTAALLVAAILSLLIMVFFGTGIRIGEAAIPGPAHDLDDPDLATDAWPDFELDGPWHDEPSADAAHMRGPAFEAAVEFRGAKPGYVFKLGGAGLGYYRDCQSETSAQPSRAAAVVLDLEALLFFEPCEIGAAAPRRRQRRARLRKRRPPRRTRRRALLEDDAVPDQLMKSDGQFRKAGLWAFDTLNGNTMSTAQDYLERTSADVCFLQEIRQTAARCPQVERTAARAGWALSTEPAADTEAGSTSAGVGVAVRAHFGLAIPRRTVDFKQLRARVHVRWMGSVCRGGLHLISAYLWTVEGLSKRNLDLLQCLAAILAGIQGPWMVAGDFNVTPEVLRASGWLSLVRGVIHTPSSATCNGKVYDYFVTSTSLSSAVAAVRVVGDSGTSPHSAVRLLLRAAPRSHKMRCLAAPYKFGAHMPQGCAPLPMSYEDVVGFDVSPSVTSENLDESFNRLISRVEGELADVCGLSGKDREKACCRAQGPRFVFRPALGPVGSPTPRVSRVTNAWRTVDAWLRQLQQGISAVGPLAHALSHSASRARYRILHTRWSGLGVTDEARVFCVWTDSIVPWMLTDRVQVAGLRCHAHAMARRGADADRRRATASWLSWLEEGPAAGLARQHRLSRVAAGWVPAKVGPVAEYGADDGAEQWTTAEEECLIAEADTDYVEVPLDAQQAADAETDKWAIEWQVGESPPIPIWPESLGQPLPPLCVDEALRACATFPAGTGLGWERLHPRALLRCSREAIVALLRLFMLAELLGRWPATMGIVIIALLPKPDGGRRPIGLFPALVRLWMRIRLPVAQAWQAAHDRPYFYAGPAKGATVAAWKQAARAELGCSVGLDYGIVLLDLVKAFERIPHDWLVRQARRYGYNLYLLRLSIAAYRLARTVRIGSVYAAAVIATRGITAGSGLATTELRVLLIEWLDEAAKCSALVTLTVYVDDVAAEAAATEARVLKALLAVVRLIFMRFTAMRLAFSGTKNVCCASRVQLGRLLVQALPELALRYQHRVTSLGSGLAAGRRRTTHVANARLSAFAQRIGRFRRLRRVGVRTDRLMRTGGTAALQFGQAVTGVSTSLLLKQRRAVAASTVSTTAGGDLDMTLLLADGGPRGRADPAFAAHMDPIWHWAMAVWESWLPRSGLCRLVADAKRRIAATTRPWSAVWGPAAAFVASAQRLGWTVHSAIDMVTDGGTRLRLSVDSPAFVRGAVDASVRRWRWRSMEHRFESLGSGGHGAGAVVQPLFKLLDAHRVLNDAWGPQQRAGLRSAVANRQWPQARLWRAGLVSSSQCQLCLRSRPATATIEGTVGDTSDVPDGTLHHRLWGQCPSLREPLEHLAPAALIREASERMREGPLDTAEWMRGLVALPLSAVPAPPAEATFVWVKRPSEGVFSGVAYTDGSLLDGPSRHCGLCSRLGWAFVVIDELGEVIAAAHGVPPPWVTTIHGAELWALQMAVQHALPGSAFRTDCLSIVEVFFQGVNVATAAGRYYARIWHVIFSALDDNESAASVDLAWMPAHTKPDDVGRLLLSDGTPLTTADRQANAEADRLAKHAAEATRVSASVRGRVDGASARARQLFEWIGHVTALANRYPLSGGGFCRDSDPGPQPARTARGARVSSDHRQRSAEHGGHLLEPHGAGWRCAVCRCSSSSWSVLAPGLCSGPALQRWTARAAATIEPHAEPVKPRAHQVVRTGDIYWCERCGAYAEQRACGLGEACRGAPANASAAARRKALQAGRHPVSRAELRERDLGLVAVPTVPDELFAAAVDRGMARWAALLSRVREREAQRRA